MTDDSPKSDDTAPKTADRIAKVMARAGIASRREAERMIIEGRVTVNGQPVESPALDVLPTDLITVDGKKLDEPQETRLWLYYKPVGLVTSEADEKGRQTVFDALPRDMPRVMSVGRLDLNSEGLLLLTNDGELKRRLELPATGWLRRYRVRVNGLPNDLTFEPLRRGVTIDGEDFAPMEVKLDSQRGTNAWLTVGIREGKNREIRRAMAHVSLQVNRLIRIGYGPFKLADLEPNEAREVKRRVLRDQLGGLLTGEEDGDDTPRGPRKPRVRRASDGDRQPFARREDGDRKPYARREDGDAPRKPRSPRPDGDRQPFARREDGDRKPYVRREDGDAPRKPRPDGDRKPYAKREDGDRKPYARREDGDAPRKPRSPRPDGDRKPYAKREDGDRKPYARREDGDAPRKPRSPRPEGDRKPYAKREDGDRKPYARREDGDAPRKPGGPKFGGKPGGPRSAGPKTGGPRPGSSAGGPRGGKPSGPRAGGAGGARPPRGPRPDGKAPRG